MQTNDALHQQFHRISQIDHALIFLGWDQLVIMPPGGSTPRSLAIAELTTMRHELLSSDRLGELLAKAQDLEIDPLQKRSLAEMMRVQLQATCVPTDLVKAKSLAGSICEHGWRAQHRENNWKDFLHNFREVVNLSRQEAQARQAKAGVYYAAPYDALLDIYCTGDDSERIQKIFTLLKKNIPDLIDEIMETQQEEPPQLLGNYPVEQQKNLNCRLMKLLGFDFQGGRLDISLHPFSTGARGDQRITTRFRESDFIDALMATAHETGHAGYENGLPQQWDGLPIGQARNMCLHESQSLLFEKHIFLSRPFLSFFTRVIHDHLEQSRNWSAQGICAAAMQVKPSLIRVEADEATYPMHIILRFEIERDLINGDLQPDDIPQAWDEKMKAYLGLSTSGNYRQGCLQDIHWTDGSFGYFPSYTLGAINAAQLFQAISANHPDWHALISQGNISFIKQWLTEHIWSKGSSMDSQEIIIGATGEETNPDYFLSHLRRRYIAD